MLETDHPNLVNMVGVAVQQRPWLMALDLCQYGDLQKLLKACQMKGLTLSNRELVLICAEVRVDVSASKCTSGCTSGGRCFDSCGHTQNRSF